MKSAVIEARFTSILNQVIAIDHIFWYIVFPTILRT